MSWPVLDAPRLLGPEPTIPSLDVLPGPLARLMDVVLTVLDLIESDLERLPIEGVGIGDESYTGRARVVSDAVDALAGGIVGGPGVKIAVEGDQFGGKRSRIPKTIDVDLIPRHTVRRAPDFDAGSGVHRCEGERAVVDGGTIDDGARVVRVRTDVVAYFNPRACIASRAAVDAQRRIVAVAPVVRASNYVNIVIEDADDLIWDLRAGLDAVAKLA